MTSAKVSSGGSDPKIFTPTYIMGWIVNFLQFLIFYSLITVMALFVVTEFQASNAMGGFAASSFIIGAVVARLFTGYVVDRLGSRQITLLGVVITTMVVVFIFRLIP